MSETNTSALDVAERNAKNLERIADSLESLAFFLNALLAGSEELQEAPATTTIMTQDGLVELR